LPDLYAIWRVQAQLVADIAAVYRKTVFLTEETMLFSLFRHAAAQAVRDLIVRTGERVLVERPTLRTLQRISAKIGAKTTQRILGRGASRWVPIVGALGVAGSLTTTPAQLGRRRWIFLAKTLTEALAHRHQKLRGSRDARTWWSKN
jgi:hypothetical protein